MNPGALPNTLAPGTYRIEAAGFLDTSGRPVGLSPGAMIVTVLQGEFQVRAVGTPSEIVGHPESARAVRLDLSNSLVVPAFVNAHTHLDLTHIGPLAPDPRGFAGFVDAVRAQRAVEPLDIEASVRKGAELSVAGGVAAVGDIGGAVRGGASVEPFRALAGTGLCGVSFVEFFAMGLAEERSIQRLDAAIDSVRSLETAKLRPGIQPHAPYSVSPGGYRHAMRLAAIDRLPIATHLAESPEEREFVGGATGPQRGLLEALGIWNDSLLTEFGRGLSPVAHLAKVLREGPREVPVLLVHLNDLSNADVEFLCELNELLNLSVAYCPRASLYFGAPERFGAHRYRELLRAGINVCLGTDSIINLPAEQALGEKGRISPLDDARLLFERDGVDGMLLLEMLTTRGARALGMDETAFTLTPGESIAGICAIEVGPLAMGGDVNELWKAALKSDVKPHLIRSAE